MAKWFSWGNNNQFDPMTYDASDDVAKQKRRRELAKKLTDAQLESHGMVGSGDYRFFVPHSKTELYGNILQQVGGKLMDRYADKKQKEMEERSDRAAREQAGGIFRDVETDNPDQSLTPQQVAAQKLAEQQDAERQIDPETGQPYPTVEVSANREPRKATRAPNQAEILDRVYTLAKTGERGQFLAEQMLAQMSAKDAEYGFEVAKDANGASIGIIRYSKTDPTKQSYTPLTGQGGQGSTAPTMKQDDARKAVEQIYKQLGPNSTQADLDGLNSTLMSNGVPQMYLTGSIDAARRIGGGGEAIVAEKGKEAMYQDIRSQTFKTKNLINELLNPKPGQPQINDREGWNGAIAAFFGGDKSLAAEGRMKEIISQTTIGLMQALKSYGVGTGAFNGEKEAERLEASLARINWQSGESEIRRQLEAIHAQMDDALMRMEADRTNQIAPLNQTNVTTSSEIAAQPGNVPKRGQSVRASDYGFGGHGASGSW